jgi:ceramide glucosyltransferase
MYINEWYAPSVLLAWLFGHQSYVSGQTMCLMTRTLQRLGGFTALANHLADDYRLGELVRGLGLRIVLSPYPVSTADHEPSLDLVTRHELRWMRTLRVLRPKSFCWIFPTFGVPLAAISFAAACAATPRPAYAGALFATAVVARLAMYFLHRIRGTQPLLLDLWLVPFRDVLLCWVWFRSFFGSRVTWRGQTFDVDPDGVMHRSV